MTPLALVGAFLVVTQLTDEARPTQQWVIIGATQVLVACAIAALLVGGWRAG